jgi:PPM family protein phosphatase
VSVGTDSDTDAGVVACRTCASPVFDDELFCEACGSRISGEPEAPQARAARLPSEREERDLGVIAALTDRGHRRPRNEDAMAIATATATATATAAATGRAVAVVCDGVASTANSHLASKAAADAVLAELEATLDAPQWPEPGEMRALMGEAFARAQVAVTLVPDDEPDGNDVSPSTTLVTAVATAERVVVGNLGDSRAYWLSSVPGRSRLLTVDDSWAQERIAEGVAADIAYADPDAHTITRWIGGDAESVVPTLTFMEVKEPGLLVLCTDGLWNYFEDVDRLGDLVPRSPTTPMQIARELTDAALEAGGQDNITVVVLPLGAAPAPMTGGGEG